MNNKAIETIWDMIRERGATLEFLRKDNIDRGLYHEMAKVSTELDILEKACKSIQSNPDTPEPSRYQIAKEVANEFNDDCYIDREKFFEWLEEKNK